MAKNEVAKKENANLTSYNEKDFKSTTAANVTKIHRTIDEPDKFTVEDIYSETVITETTSSKKK